MKPKNMQKTGTTIMLIALIIGIYALITNQNNIYDISTLIILIGIIINNIGTYKILKKYRTKYGDIE